MLDKTQECIQADSGVVAYIGTNQVSGNEPSCTSSNGLAAENLLCAPLSFLDGRGFSQRRVMTFDLPASISYASGHAKKGCCKNAWQKVGRTHGNPAPGSEILDEEIAKKLYDMGKLGLPWKRGPRAYEVAKRANGIRERLNASRRGFYSLRRAARLFGVSTQPIRDWIRLGHLKREGPRHLISHAELIRFLDYLVEKAEPFDPHNYVRRIEKNRKFRRYQWRKLSEARFEWPRKYQTRTPSELAGLIGCHPSLIIRAIYSRRVNGFRPTPCRWAIKRRSWQKAFLSFF